MSDLSALHAAEVLALEFIESLPVPAALHRGEALIAANAAFQRLCGRDQPELQACEVAQLIDPAHQEDLRRAGLACLHEQGEPPALPTELLRLDGSRRQVEITQRRISLGGSAAVLLTCIDHSDIHHVQSSLFALSSMLRQIVDNGPVASFVVDMEHRVTHWNQACERLTGTLARDIVGEPGAWRPFYEDRRGTLADLLVSGVPEQELLAAYRGDARPSALMPGSYEVEAYFPNLGGVGRWLYFTAAPLRDQNGQMVGAIETLQDITRRREVEEELMCHRTILEELVEVRSQALAASARELENFIDNAPIGVAFTRAHKISRCNRAMEQMFATPPGALHGRPTKALFGSEAEFNDFIREVGVPLLAGRPAHLERWMRRDDGRQAWLQLNAFMPNPADPKLGTWWMVQDRSEMRATQTELREQFERMRQTNRKLEEAQNQLLQSEKMASIGQLAAGVAHEINNPVGFVSSNLNTLRQYVDGLLRLVDALEASAAHPGDADLRSRADAVREDVELDYLKEDLPALMDESADGLSRVKKIVQDLKDFSRVDQAEWQEADLNAGLESTLNVVRNEVKYKAEVVKRLGELPLVNCLAAQLNQVFLNLIVNAVHAIPERGTITLSSGHVDGWVWIQVDDDGKGMTDEVRRRVFEPFFTTKAVGQGTGLGLSLSFSIVQKHKGQIDLRSTPGKGSSFRVWVPEKGPESVAVGAAVPAWPEEPQP